MILIYPPVSKSCEPPAGVALLAGALRQHHIDCRVIDANVEAMLWLSGHEHDHGQKFHDHQGLQLSPDLEVNPPSDSWTKRAKAHLARNFNDIRDIQLYSNISRYRQRLMDINRIITTSVSDRYKISLSDYADARLSPLKSPDLIYAAENYAENPFYPYFEYRLAQDIEAGFTGQKAGADLIGISLCYLSQALTAFALAGWIKVRFPGKRIVMGGGLVTSWMSSPKWSNPFKGIIDIMVKGRGEESLIRLAGGSPLSHERVTPDFDFCNWDSYIAPGRILPFRTAGGCYWRRCRFCPERAEARPYQPESNRDLLNDLNLLSQRYDLNYIHFIDDAIPPSFLKALVEAGGILKNRGIRNTAPASIDCRYGRVGKGRIKRGDTAPLTWYGFVRFTKELADPGFCRALYRSGCRMLKLGLESGDQTVLDRMEKGTRLELASQVLTALGAAGIHTYVYLLFGTAFEDEAAAHKTLEYVKEHSNCISFLNLAIFNLPRFSDDARHLETDMFYGGDLSLYLNFKHPSGWGRREIRQFLDKTFKKERCISAILKNDPPFFTSNHAMFMIDALNGAL